MGDVSLIRQAYRFALDPTVEQQGLLASFTGASRFWFNQVSPSTRAGHSPPKREDSPSGEPTQTREGLAVAA